MSHKYGFQNPEDFLLVTRTISKYYKNSCSDGGDTELVDKFSFLNQELRQLVPVALAARMDAVEYALNRWDYLTNSIKCVESFSWDTRLILGESSIRSNVRQVATINLHCRSNLRNETLYFEMDLIKLNALIEVLENSLKKVGPLKK